jgi:hypothetical protein
MYCNLTALLSHKSSMTTQSYKLSLTCNCTASICGNLKLSIYFWVDATVASTYFIPLTLQATGELLPSMIYSWWILNAYMMLLLFLFWPSGSNLCLLSFYIMRPPDRVICLLECFCFCVKLELSVYNLLFGCLIWCINPKKGIMYFSICLCLWNLPWSPWVWVVCHIVIHGHIHSSVRQYCVNNTSSHFTKSKNLNSHNPITWLE